MKQKRKNLRGAQETLNGANLSTQKYVPRGLVGTALQPKTFFFPQGQQNGTLDMKEVDQGISV